MLPIKSVYKFLFLISYSVIFLFLQGHGGTFLCLTENVIFGLNCAIVSLAPSEPGMSETINPSQMTRGTWLSNFWIGVHELHYPI